jgi:hypothetical protein
MLALAGPLLALAALPSEEPRRTLDELVENAERIVVARVERVHRLQGPDLLELAVERTLFGPNAARLFARVPDGFATSPGAEVVAFLDPWRLPEERGIERIVQDAPLTSALTLGALWPIDDGRLDGAVTDIITELGSVAPEVDSLVERAHRREPADDPRVARYASGWMLTVRTRAGRTDVTIHDGELSERTPPAERATAERALRILAALPIAEARH